MEQSLKDLVQVVVLNGASSAGKSSLARALQEITWPPFLHVQLDTFTQMLPASFKTSTSRAEQDIDEIVAQTRRGMRNAVAAMAAEGLRLVIDDVLDEAAATDYLRVLSPYRTCLVGILTSVEILEQRERERGDRVIGLARSQLAFVHRNMTYDVTVDTTSITPAQGALQIRNMLSL
jgi:chloramphenicol 3-O phosphotransferase